MAFLRVDGVTCCCCSLESEGVQKASLLFICISGDWLAHSVSWLVMRGWRYVPGHSLLNCHTWSKGKLGHACITLCHSLSELTAVLGLKNSHHTCRGTCADNCIKSQGSLTWVQPLGNRFILLPDVCSVSSFSVALCRMIPHWQKSAWQGFLRFLLLCP